MAAIVEPCGAVCPDDLVGSDIEVHGIAILPDECGVGPDTHVTRVGKNRVCCGELSECSRKVDLEDHPSDGQGGVVPEEDLQIGRNGSWGRGSNTRARLQVRDGDRARLALHMPWQQEQQQQQD